MKDLISSFFIFNRSVFDWKYYTDGNVFRVFFHCVGKANHTDKYWRGIQIKRGEFITSLENLSNELALSIAKVRLAIKKLDEDGCIIYKPSNKYSKIVIPNYDIYQTNNVMEILIRRHKSQTKNNQINTTNNENNDDNEKENVLKKDSFIEKRAKILGRHFNSVMANPLSVSNYCDQYRLTKKELKDILNEFNLEMLWYQGQRISINRYYSLFDGFIEGRFPFLKRIDDQENMREF